MNVQAAMVSCQINTSQRWMILAITCLSAVIKWVLRPVDRLRQLENTRHSVLCCHRCAALSAFALIDCSAITQSRHVRQAAAYEQHGTEVLSP